MKKSNLLIAAIILTAVTLPIWLYLANPYNTASTELRARILGYVPYRIPASSMADTLIPGDFILVKSFAYRKKGPAIGDVIVFLYPGDETISYVKRVVATGGDRVSIVEGFVHLNGNKLDEPYARLQSGDDPDSRQMDEVIVPQNQLFVLGDNRDRSNDSRYWGYLPAKNLVGKVTYTWFSKDLSRIGPCCEEDPK